MRKLIALIGVIAGSHTGAAYQPTAKPATAMHHSAILHIQATLSWDQQPLIAASESRPLLSHSAGLNASHRCLLLSLAYCLLLVEMANRASDHSNSPSFKYEDAPDELPHLSELVESPADHPAFLHTDGGDDVLELQPSPPQTPQHAHHETALSDDTVGEGSLSVDVDDSNFHKETDDMHSVAQSPVSAVSLPVANPPASSVPVAVPHQLPVAVAAPAAQPVAAAVLPPPPPPPPPVDPVVAERAAKRGAFFKAQAQRSQNLAASATTTHLAAYQLQLA